MSFWGDYENKVNNEDLDFIDKLLNTIPSDEDDVFEPPALKKLKYKEPKEISEEHFRLDPVSLNNVDQMKYCLTAHHFICELNKKKSLDPSDESYQEQISKPPKINVDSNKPFLFSVDRISKLIESDFTQGNFSKSTGNILDITAISSDSINKLIRRSLAIICINAGFTECTESCMDILMSVFHHFMRNLCTKLSAFTSPSNPLNMPDFVSKVFLESGLGHPDELIGWYMTHVVNLNKRLANQNQELYEKCLEKQQELIPQQ